MKKRSPPKRIMQNVRFNSMDEFLDYLPEEELKIVEVLRKLIFENIPGIREKLSYQVPFYHRHAVVCFIWPGSVSWGGISRKGVRLGFSNGYLLNDETGYLDKGERKQIYIKDFFHVNEIDLNLLKSYLFDALRVDEEKATGKKEAKRQSVSLRSNGK